MLDACRIELEYSWRDVARETGVSPSTFSRIKNGLETDISNFVKLVRWLGVDANKILGLSVESKPCRHLVLERVNAKGNYACNVCGEIVEIVK